MNETSKHTDKSQDNSVTQFFNQTDVSVDLFEFKNTSPDSFCPVEIPKLSTEVFDGMDHAYSSTLKPLVNWQIELALKDLVKNHKMSYERALKTLRDNSAYYERQVEQGMIQYWRSMVQEASERHDGGDRLYLEPYVAQDNEYRQDLPEQAVGFIDLVDYTRYARTLDDKSFLSFVKDFEEVTTETLKNRDSRLVKTLGDGILYLDDTLEGGVKTAAYFLENLRTHPRIPRARAGLSWGGVVVHHGDVYGHGVNLAGHLSKVGPADKITTTRGTAQLFEAQNPTSRFAVDYKKGPVHSDFEDVILATIFCDH